MRAAAARLAAWLGKQCIRWRLRGAGPARPGDYNVEMMDLPRPEEEALAVSRALTRAIAQRIEHAGGWIGFDAFMAAALYEPGFGYYTGNSRKFGRGGDFVTAPELSPLFGACVAAQCAQWLESAPGVIVEFGAGTGMLAAHVLNELARLGIEDVGYQIIELSAPLRAVQRHTIETLAPQALARVSWLDELPERIDGVVIANEVLDAIPVRRFVCDGPRVLERGVALREEPGAADDPFAPAFGWADRPADQGFDEQVRCALARSRWPDEERGPGYESELGEQAQAWVETVGARIGCGAMLLIDYGFPAGEFFHPQRSAGTIACHYRHRVHFDPFVLPGLQDVTSHVDFSAIAAGAENAGLAPLGYTSQANFLLNAGLLDRLALMPQGEPLAHARQTQAVQVPVSEAGMGELFKVIAFGRGVPDDAIGFSRGDRYHALT